MATTTVQSVIFDYGGVLCHLPSDETFGGLASLAGLSTPELLQWFWHHRLTYDRGDFDDRMYWKAIGTSAGKQYTPEQVQKFVEVDCRFWLTLDEPMLEWNRTLRKAGYKTAVLSNMPECLGIHLRQNTNLFDEFDHVTLSYEIRSAKPESKIYRSCLAGLGLKAGDALFLDDKEPNVRAAQATGLHSIIYANRAKFSGREAAYGLPPIPVD
ncbi:MAG TPA: HAD family phosphatase [Bryobacteraceae bacterium]